MQNPRIIYHEANEADAETLVGVINRAFAIELKFFSTERIDLAEALEHFRKGTFLIAEVGGEIAGCVYVSARDGRGYFGLLAVEPKYQGLGLGKKLIEDAENFCRNAGCALMEIYVLNHRTELPPLYEKLGYTVAGIEEPDPQKPSARQPYHFILMEKSLS